MDNTNTEFDEETVVNLTKTIVSHDVMVQCGRCGENMTYSKYKTKHRLTHYNLCWLEGEEIIDYFNVHKTSALLRAFSSKYTVNNKKVIFKCEWCRIKKKSVPGYASHLKKCVVRLKADLSPNKTNEKIVSKYKLDAKVTCARCNKIMSLREYERKHRQTHYNICWLIGEEKPDIFDDGVAQSLLRKALPKNAVLKDNFLFNCEWCPISRKSVSGFASHIKRHVKQFILNKVVPFNENEDNITTISVKQITDERVDSSVVTCGHCNKEMTFKEYHVNHNPINFNLCWIVSEDKLEKLKNSNGINIEQSFSFNNEYVSNENDASISIASLPPEIKIKKQSESEMIEDDMPGQFDLQSILIQAVEARPLLWNDNTQLNKCSEIEKNKLWNEVFIEMNGIISQDEIKCMWSYLKEKYAREKNVNESKVASRIPWIHFESLAFLEEVQYTDEISNDLNFNRSDVSILDIKTESQVKLKEVIGVDDEDVGFIQYLASILKEVPERKKRRLQAELISKVVSEMDYDQ